MADWIHPGQPLSAVAALAIVDGASPGPRATAGTLELLPHLAASGMRVAVVGGQAADGDGWAALADHQALQRWLSDLAIRDGIGPGLVAAIVDGPCDAGLEAVPRLRLVRPAPVGQPGDLVDRLREQVHRMDEVPGIDDDPAWVVRLAGAGTRKVRVDETLATVADGSFATRGSLEEDGPDCDELVLANGVYTDDRMPTGMSCPLWTRVEMDPVPTPGQRWFDLRTGVLLRRDTSGWSHPPVQSLRFACLARPGTVVLRLEGPLHDTGGPAVRVPATTGSVQGEEGQDRERAWATTWSGASRVVAAGVQHHTPQQGGGRLDRMAAYMVVSDLVAGRREVRSDVAAAEALGVNRLLVEQRRAWAQRWQDADAGIDGDVELTRSVRFAVHHLLATVPDRGEASVGARGLSGPAYAGHVFWDADVFVLPALAALRPRAAVAMLAYRLARLPEARARAAGQGHDGALFPWESADEGRDVTPHQIVDEDGDRVPVLTGQHALHITADVAWAACRYAAWSGDTTWLAGPGRDLVVEPARFWASRLEVDADGTAHLRGVVGPDEYHGPVDDDVHTNVLARWNLRAAAALVSDDAGPEARAEQRRWLDLADRIVDGHLPVSGRHEQFAGFDDLEPLVISNIADVPVAADVLLGRDRVASAQVVKQPDVLMAHHMVADEMPPDSLTVDLDHEGPRLAHGSSLSPAIVAGLFARAGRPDDGEPLFRLAARLDLEDLTGTTAGGLHLATMGGLWQALVSGFAGVEPTTDALIVDPHLPSAWPGLHVTVRHRGVRLRIEARHESVTVTSDAPVPVRFGRDRHPELVDGRHTHAWRPTTSEAKVSP